MSTHERELLNAVLSDRQPLLNALLAWKEGATLEEELRRHRLLDSGEGTVDDQGTRVHVSEPGAGPIFRVSGERYRKVRPHAKGALGEVFVAHDEELDRDVALKEIQSHQADDAGSQGRFVREARLTGQLEHPGIVPVYGLGLYPDGRPYYAMRFIEGEPFSEAIKTYHASNQEPLALRQLLGRFVAVCNAVGYAHSRGVIHRDLKPANVMLGAFGETLVVDWGLARRKDEGGRMKDEGRQQDSDSSFIPHPSSVDFQTQGVLGTPAYMAPEQARGDNEQVGPGSDIHALGATLYHLLTGRAPIAPGPLGEMLRKVTQRDFPTPRQVKADVPRALEAVVLKAMAATIEDRYATAQELAAEVERWLADEPVRAYREPVWDRVRRWGRRHRTLVTSSVAVLLVSVIGLTVGLGAVSAEQARTAAARDDALAAEKEAKSNERRALKAEKEARGNLAVAEENLKLARKAVNDTFDLAKDHELFQRAGMQEARKVLLEKALPFYKKFQARAGNDAEGKWELADQHFHIGYITGEIGDRQEALNAYQRAEGLLRALVKNNPSRVLFRIELARTLNNIANLLQASGKPTEALEAFARASEIQQQLATDDPAAKGHRLEQATTLTNLGLVLSEMGKSGDALKAYRQAIALTEKLLEASPRNATYQHALARTLTNMGNVLSERGDRSEALKAQSRARSLFEKLVANNPTATYRQALGATLNNLGNLLGREGLKSEALKALTQARDLQEALLKANPAVTEYQKDLAVTLNNLGYQLLEEKKQREALEAFTRSGELFERLMKANPLVTEFRYSLAGTLLNKGLLFREAKQPRKSLADLDRALELVEGVLRSDPRSASATGLRNYVYYHRARTLTDLGRYADAAGAWSLFLKVAPARMRTSVRLRRADCLAKAGQSAQAMREAETIEKSMRLTPVDFYDLACVAALCASKGDASQPLPRREHLEEGSASKALLWLKEAHKGGYFKTKANRDRLRKDPDLASLRDRADFKRFLHTITP